MSNKRNITIKKSEEEIIATSQPCEEEIITSARPSEDSIDSYPNNFRIIYGRKFNSDNNEILPLSIDLEEMDRMKIIHINAKHMFHGNYNAPVEDILEEGAMVLDVGCGSGPWTTDMATEYPNSTFIGIDKETILFPTSDLPKNCIFQYANMLNRLPFDDETFDYVYSRNMHRQFATDEWHRLIKELKRVTKGGGVIELNELGGHFENKGPKFALIFNTISSLLVSLGLDLHIPEKLNECLSDFQDVSTDYVSVPIGWHGRIGQLSKYTMKLSFMAMKPYFCTTFGWEEKEFDEVAEESLENCHKYKTWCNTYYAFGTKPLDQKVDTL